MLFYHVTPTRNVENIQKNGIIPQIGERSQMIQEPIPQVYLFHSRDDLATALGNWLGELYNDSEMLTIFTIEINLNDPCLDHSTTSNFYESYYRCVITPDMIIGTFHEDEFF